LSNGVSRRAVTSFSISSRFFLLLLLNMHGE